MVGSNVLEQGTYYKAEKFIPHEKYKYPEYAFNIGLIRVQGALQLNQNVQPIKLSTKDIEADVDGIATAWGPVSIFMFNLQNKINFISFI